MSSHGTVIDVSVSELATKRIETLTEYWHDGLYDRAPHPRSLWLSHVETELAHYFPAASSRDRNVTARSLAPFPLKEKP